MKLRRLAVVALASLSGCAVQGIQSSHREFRVRAVAPLLKTDVPADKVEPLFQRIFGGEKLRPASELEAIAVTIRDGLKDLKAYEIKISSDEARGAWQPLTDQVRLGVDLRIIDRVYQRHPIKNGRSFVFLGVRWVVKARLRGQLSPEPGQSSLDFVFNQVEHALRKYFYDRLEREGLRPEPARVVYRKTELGRVAVLQPPKALWVPERKKNARKKDAEKK